MFRALRFLAFVFLVSISVGVGFIAGFLATYGTPNIKLLTMLIATPILYAAAKTIIVEWRDNRHDIATYGNASAAVTLGIAFLAWTWRLAQHHRGIEQTFALGLGVATLFGCLYLAKACLKPANA